MIFLTLLCCFAWIAAATRDSLSGTTSDFLDGTILFRTRNSDLLDRYILSGQVLSQEQIRDATGLRSVEVCP